MAHSKRPSPPKDDGQRAQAAERRDATQHDLNGVAQQDGERNDGHHQAHGGRGDGYGEDSPGPPICDGRAVYRICHGVDRVMPKQAGSGTTSDS
jgi:hypothetical protein